LGVHSFILMIEKIVKIPLPPLFDVLSFHQELIHLILNAFNLFEVPRVPFPNPSYLVDILLPQSSYAFNLFLMILTILGHVLHC
jgi:hypothetical protein